LTNRIANTTAPAIVAPIAIAHGAPNSAASAPACVAPTGPTPISACA
jgi:hypothetical protein